ncbi:glycoside hydrolase family 5 protein [Burkholderiaceae bacterium UC74_6]
MIRTVLIAALLCGATAAHAANNNAVSTTPPLEWRGVSLSSAEWGEKNLPGVYDKDYVYPSVDSTVYYQRHGMNLMRIAFRWERLQPKLQGDFDAAELKRLHEFVDGATARGLSVLLDPHNYAAYVVKDKEQRIGSQDVSILAFADLWKRLALEFKGNPQVLFGLMNEPHSLQTETWIAAAQIAVDTIRHTGATNFITVPGNGYTGAWSWFESKWYGTANAEVMGRLRDPAGRVLIEVHQYFDKDGSGTSPECVSPTIGRERLERFTAWARQYGYRALLGELGGGDNATCAQAVQGALEHLHGNADVWAGWLWWAGGPRWGDYMLSIEPYADGRERGQMKWLEPWLGRRGN